MKLIRNKSSPTSRLESDEKSYDVSKKSVELAIEAEPVGEDESDEDPVEMIVMDALARKTSKLTMEHIQELVGVIKGLAKKPLSAEVMNEMRERENKSVRDKHVLNKAATLLRIELEQLHQRLSDQEGADDTYTRPFFWRIQLIEAALPALDCPRVYYIENYDENTKILQGPPQPAWMAMAGLISRFALEALRAGGSNQASVGGRDGPIVRCVEVALRLIQPDEKVPARETILGAIKPSRPKKLARSK